MSTSAPTTRATSMLAQGLVSRPDAVAEIRETIGDPHSGPGGRAYRLTLSGGLSVEVLPERGLDIGTLWYRGHPISWRSPLADPGPANGTGADGWIGRFGGGMLATCGLDNIGPARGSAGQHGSHHASRATDVVVQRTPGAGVVVSGVVDSARVFGRNISLHRSIETRADSGVLVVRDRITNDGPASEPVALLYHLNFGAPFLMPGTEVAVAADTHELREPVPQAPTWQAFPEPTSTVVEAVWEHAGLHPDEAGRARATVRSAALGLDATVTWDGEVLPRCFQWVYPTAGGWALGIEPANAPLFGPDRDGPHAGAPLLEPGAHLDSGFALTLSIAGAVPGR